MARAPRDTTVLTIRVPSELERRLTREARRRRRSKSAVASDLLEAALSQGGPDLASEARRQSQLVSRRASERDVMRFIGNAFDMSGWE